MYYDLEENKYKNHIALQENLYSVEVQYSKIRTKSSVNINCKEIKQATVKDQFKPSAKLSTQTRKVLRDHKNVS